jgi:hypothetical protein
MSKDKIINSFTVPLGCWMTDVQFLEGTHSSVCNHIKIGSG